MIYTFGGCVLDTHLYTIQRAGQTIRLRPKVFQILLYLLEHRDHVIPKDELSAYVWPAQFISAATLESTMRAVRQALGDTGRAQHLIQTLPGRGYRFVGAVEVRAPGPTHWDASAAPHGPHDASAPLLVPSRRSLALPAAAPVDPRPDAAPSPSVLSRPPDVPPPPAMEMSAGERKLVTLLGCTLVPAGVLRTRRGLEALHRQIRILYTLAQQEVGQYGGTLQQVAGDRLLAVFGAPLALEDHARRAVYAAWGLHQRLAAWQRQAGTPLGEPLAACIGLHTGLIVVGGIGEPPASTLQVIGDLPRTVEALEAQAAPGTTLCSAATASLVQGDVQLKPVPAVAVAGHAQPLLAYEVLDVQPPDRASAWRRRPTRSRFVGRTRELATLHTLLAEVESGRGQVVGIVGEIGIGKSRLLAEFQHQVHGRRLTYLQGRCLAYGQATPYLPVLGLLRHACGITAADSPAMCTAKVQRALQEAGLDVDEVALPLLALLGVEAGTAALAALPPEVRKARIFTALGQFYIQKSRQGPLILEVEDLHWSDAMSAAWLEAFVERVVRSPILVLGTYRPGYRPAWLDKSYATQVALPPLAPGESHHLVQALLPTASATLAQAIVVKAEGNPFFLEELAQMVGEQEGDGLPLGVPDTVQAVLAARIDRLPSEVKHLLQVAAVIGMEVPVPLVQALTALPDEALERGLAHLQAAEFLYETHAFPAREYTFKHAFTQEVAYGSLLEASRRELHARIVEALEALYPDRLVEQVERLASHALRGELWEKAVPYCQQAGAQARARTAYGEAVHFLDQALAALAHLPESPTTLAQAIDVRLALQYPLQKLGQLQMELARVREAAAVAEALRDRGRQGWVSVYLCVVNRIVAANYAAAIDAGHRALVMATDLDDHRLEAHAAYALGQAYWTVGDLGRALNCLQRSVDLTAGYPDLASDEAQRRGWLARTLSFLGRFGDATTSAEQALRLAAARDDIGGRIQAQTTLGEVALGQGDLPRALECLEESVMLTRTWNIMDWGISAIKCLGAAYALTERGAEAVPLVEEALERTRGVGAMGILTDALRVLGEVYLCAGRLDAAYEHAQQALERARQYTERAFEAQVLRLLGEIAVQREPPAVAQAHTSYRQALVLAEELGMRPLQAHCYRGLGTLYTKTGQQEQARTALSVAIDLYRTMTMTLWLPQVEAVLAQVK